MIHKRFTILLLVRIGLLLITLCVFAYIFGDERLVFNHLILGIIILAQVGELIRFVNYTNRELARLFFSVRHRDFSVSFQQGYVEKSFKDLRDSLTEIIKAYKEAKIEEEARFLFLQMLVNQLQVGIITLENNHDVTLINPAAEQLLSIHGIKNWKHVQSANPSFARELEQLGDNGRKLIEIKSNQETRMVAVDVKTLQILEKSIRLITLQDINSEIEQKEIEAWHKLIRILTHEIMNSVTPITSLTETMQSMLEDKSGKQKELHDLKEETISDIRFSLKTIQKRSEGILNFVDSYRKFTRVPKPVPERVNLSDLFASVDTLMRYKLEQKGIHLDFSTAPDATHAWLDKTLTEQALINLVTNSMHALEGRSNPVIKVRSYHQDQSLVLEIQDNGKGIPEKERASIFIPFYTTKKDGSGIGLSLSKQIVTLHGGRIKVLSEVDKGTTFMLFFRNSG